jgi:hypothetical protein
VWVIIVKIKLLLIVVLFFWFSIHSAVADSKYPKTDSQTLEKMKKKATFKMLVPHKLNPNWTLEVKFPYPLDMTKPLDSIRLHYFNKDDAFMVGIEQFKANGHKIAREETKIDVSNGKTSHSSIIEDFTPDYSGEAVFVNNREGRFTTFQGSSGGILWWIQGNTYLCMDSPVLTKKEMLKLARSIK